MTDVVALGELLIDFTTQSTDGEGYPTMAAHPGGAPANFLAALAKFGAKTALLGKVGDREFSFARKPGADTCLRYEELDLSLIDEARAFHFGTLSLTDQPARGTTARAVAYARKRGKLITFDPNLRKPLWNSLEEAKELMLWGLGQADVVKISDEEVEFLFGMTPEEGARHILDTYGVGLVFVTCGPDGCVFKNSVAEGRVPGLSGLDVVDTTGAGDIFGGSALWKLLQLGKDVRTLTEAEMAETARFACASAGLSTTQYGGISSVPDYAEVTARLAGK